MREGWKRIRLDDVFSVSTAKLGTHSEEPAVFAISKYDGVVLSNDYHGHRVSSAKLDGYKVLEIGGWAYSTIHIDEGSIARNNHDVPGVVSPMYTILRWISNDCAPAYFEHLLRTSEMLTIYKDMAQGSINRRRSLPWKTFSAIEVEAPPLEEQQRFVDLIGTLDEAIVTANAAVENSKILATQIRSQMISSREANASFRDVAELQRGFDLPVGQRGEGQIPVIASGGPVGSHNEAKVLGPGVVTGRSGTIGVVQYIMDDFWPLNTTLYVKDFKANFPPYIRYLLEAMDLEHHAGGSTVPSLNRNVLDNIRVYVPDMRTQQLIAETLDSVWASVIAATAYADSLRTLRSELLIVLLSGEHEIPESYDVDTAAQLEPAA